MEIDGLRGNPPDLLGDVGASRVFVVRCRARWLKQCSHAMREEGAAAAFALGY